MKLNWGNVLLIFFIIYISLLVRIVIKSFSVDHTLVVENYYEHDIRYQEKLDKINNRKLLPKDLNLSVKEGSLHLDFGPESDIALAKVKFYRASDKKSDVTKEIKEIDQFATIPLEEMKKGLWQIQVEWKDDVRTYFKEQNFYL